MRYATGRSGFTMIEMIVLLAVIVMISAMAIPSVITTLDRQRVERAIVELDRLMAGIVEFESGVGDWPGSLSHLTNAITTGDADVCGTAFNNGDTNGWVGPYVIRPIGTAGTNVFVGVANNTIARNPSPPPPINGNEAGELQIVIPNVREEDVLELDRQKDASDGLSAGMVRWTAGSNTMTVQYTIAIAGC